MATSDRLSIGLAVPWRACTRAGHDLVFATEAGETPVCDPKAALEDPKRQFVRGPSSLTARGTETDDQPAFVVEDDNYVSARWPGDAYLFARRFLARL